MPAPTYSSVNPAHNISSTCGEPNFVPKRDPRITCGVIVIFSVPPVSATRPSPNINDCVAEIIACKPEPHKRLTDKEGLTIGTHLHNATCLAKYSELHDE